MRRFTGFEHGMGIGGWLTNYKRFNVLPQNRRLMLTIGDMEHFASYITEEDVAYIAKLGMDHIRLGFDQIVVEEVPGVYREEIFKHIDNFIAWCNKYGLNVVLNLHKAVGNYCDIQEEVELLDDEGLQERFIALWLAFENRYAQDNSIAFELLNEVRDVDPVKWNQLAQKTINAIRQQNPDRKLIIGSTCWNSVQTLDKLQIFEDANVIYTFHMYEPFEFTHQRGVLQADTLFYNRKMPYPCDIERYRDFRRTLFGANDAYSGLAQMDSAFIRQFLKPAADWIKAHPDKILWCGEFGTIRHADIRWRENWMQDVIAFLKEQEIPYCVWNYLSTPNDGNRFSLVDDDNRQILSEKMARIIRGEKI
ncbi:MAG: cellulase family glycosylhydrolase [Lachnospiraceae bacterium]|nr:cellulase family glycosylhydrolase [Lachnospiraceae bacterium]